MVTSNLYLFLVLQSLETLSLNHESHIGTIVLKELDCLLVLFRLKQAATDQHPEIAGLLPMCLQNIDRGLVLSVVEEALSL
jgi:hypothetical protein